MNTINVDLSTGEALNLPIGRQGENNVTQVIFDFSALKTEFGSGTLSLSVKRPKEYVPYAQTMTISGTNATWLVNETDTGNFGCGEIQLTYTVSGKVAKTVIYKYTVLRSIGADGEYPIPGQTWQEEIEDDIAEIKEDLAALEGGGMSDDVKSALLQIAQKVVYVDDGGQTYYQDLYDALYPPAPPATLSYITCVYTQSGTVYDTDTLDSLKADLVVTAHYDNSTTQTVTAYTLSGTLTAGTSTITVSYNGKTTTFNVTVTHQSQTLKVYFNTLQYTEGTCIKGDGSTASVGGGGYVELPYIDGMYIYTVLAAAWSNYQKAVLYDGTSYTNVSLTKESVAVSTLYGYDTTLTGQSGIQKVYINFDVSKGLPLSYYEVEV